MIDSWFGRRVGSDQSRVLLEPRSRRVVFSVTHRRRRLLPGSRHFLLLVSNCFRMFLDVNLLKFILSRSECFHSENFGSSLDLWRKSLLLLLFWDKVSLHRPGWSAVSPSLLTAASASQAQGILLLLLCLWQFLHLFFSLPRSAVSQLGDDTDGAFMLCLLSFLLFPFFFYSVLGFLPHSIFFFLKSYKHILDSKTLFVLWLFHFRAYWFYFVKYLPEYLRMLTKIIFFLFPELSLFFSFPVSFCSSFSSILPPCLYIADDLWWPIYTGLLLRDCLMMYRECQFLNLIILVFSLLKLKLRWAWPVHVRL